jgi:hypothetical protein
MRSALLVAALVAAPALVAADKPQPLTPIDLKANDIPVVQPKGGSPLEPTEIKTSDELAKSPLFGAGAADKLKKFVNFEKEKLVVFAWSGSGRDALAGSLVTADKKVTAQFLYTPGATKDNRPHFRAFVAPKDADVKVERNSRVPK